MTQIISSKLTKKDLINGTNIEFTSGKIYDKTYSFALFYDAFLKKIIVEITMNEFGKYIDSVYFEFTDFIKAKQCYRKNIKNIQELTVLDMFKDYGISPYKRNNTEFIEIQKQIKYHEEQIKVLNSRLYSEFKNE